MKNKISLRLMLAFFFLLSAIAVCFGQTSLPAAVGVIPIGKSGGWDDLTVDTASHRLYVSHGTCVDVIDLDLNRILAEIPNTPRVHGIAIVPEFGRGFISNGGDSSVTVFNLKTDSTIANIKVTGRSPDAILFDSFSRRVFVFNGRSSNASVIDADSLKVIATIPLSGKPEFARSDDKGRVYVNIEDKSTIAVIDSKAFKVIAEWPLAPCEEPSAMAIDRENRRLFVGGGNQLMAVVDAESGRVVASIPIGKGVDGNGFDPLNHLAFSSNGEGTLTVIKQENPNKYSVIGTVRTEPGARTMTLDERTHRLYLPVGTRPDSTKVTKDDFRVLIYQ